MVFIVEAGRKKQYFQMAPFSKSYIHLNMQCPHSVNDKGN